MIVEKIIKYLTGQGFAVYAERPEKPPEQYLIVQQLGGGRTNGLQRARVAIQSYGGSLFDAMQLDKDMRDAMQNAAMISNLSGCVLEENYNYTLTSAKQYRYQSVYNIHYYE